MAVEKEQREAGRFPINSATMCVLASPVAEDFGLVRIKNISTQGIGLITSKSVATGSLLAVKLANPAKNFTRTLLVRVVHVTPQPGSFLIGGTLDTPLTYEELCAFVM